jgi:hypothetical protein
MFYLTKLSIVRSYPLLTFYTIGDQVSQILVLKIGEMLSTGKNRINSEGNLSQSGFGCHKETYINLGQSPGGIRHGTD